jgi:hypothetical protein
MELSSPESIRTLMGTYWNPTAARRRRGAQDAAQRASKGRRTRCGCGHCRQCLDNLRWERIFAEKFADPNYYTRSVVHIASPLTSL